MRIEWVLEVCRNHFWQWSGQWEEQESAEHYLSKHISDFPEMKARIVKREIICSYNPN
jgi:hypothetical protein